MNRSRPPAVSVITPFYNRAEFFQDIVETLHRQSLKDFELVVVDDGSDDDLRFQVDRAQTSFSVRLIRLDRNKGGASARNAGIDNSCGRYVAFLDSDDDWMPEKLLRQFQQLENAKDRGSLVSLTRQLVVGARKYEAPRRLMTRLDPVGEYLFQRGGVIQSSMMFMAADLAKSVRFEEGARGHDDWSFALRLARAGARFEMLPEALTIYNNSQGRTRRSPAYSPARLDWLDRWRRDLGEAPYLAARAAFISNMGTGWPPGALHAIASAVWRGAIPLWRGFYYATVLAFPGVRRCAVLAKELRSGAGKDTSLRREHFSNLAKSGRQNQPRGLSH
jgi:glycosyltransferase involved in cell wall biosynthesis